MPAERKFSYRFPSSPPAFEASRLTELRPDGTRYTTGGGVEWSKSIYYWWWLYLRASQRFQKVCAAGGKGGNAKLRQIYADFGNVFEYEENEAGFRAWTRSKDDRIQPNRIAYLFGYKSFDQIQIMQAGEQIDGTDALVLAIPLGMRRREINSQLDTILKRELKRQRGQRYKDVPVRYKPLHERMHGLESALLVYKTRNANPNMSLWEVAHHAGIRTKVTLEDDETESGKRTHAADKKAYLAQHTHRLYARAEKVIAGVERGEFPVTK